MNKITSFLVMGLLLTIVSFSNAQSSITLVPETTSVQSGETVCIPVKVTGFQNIAGVQFILKWNPAELEFSSVDMINGLTGLSTGNGISTSAGELRLQWDAFGNGVDPVDIADGSTIFRLCLTAKGNDVDAPIVFGTTPIGTEVINGNDELLETATTGATITIGTSGGNGGNGGSTGEGPVEFVVSQESAGTGDQVCVDITVNNFASVSGVQYTLKFDPAILQFNSFQNLNLPELTTENFGDGGDGIILFSWSRTTDPDGVTLPDGTRIFSLCFTVLGAGGTRSDVSINDTPRAIEVIDAQSTVIPHNVINGFVQVTGDGGGASGFTVAASDESGMKGESVCVKVTVENFKDIFGFQWSMNWDPAIISFDEVRSFGLPGLSANSFTLTAPGKLRVLWTDPAQNGITLNGTSLIYEVCFNIQGGAATSTDVSFTDDPIQIEAIGANNSEAFVNTNKGSVNVIGDGGFTVFVDSATGNTGEEVCLPVTAGGFNDIVSIQWSTNWDPNIAEFVRVQNFGLPGLTENRFASSDAGKLRLLWFDNSLSGVTVASDHVLYEICFKIKGSDGSQTGVNITNDPTRFEVIQKDEEGRTAPIETSNVDGSITVGSTAVLTISVPNTTITHVSCFGQSTGAIDLAVSGGTEPLTYAWSNGAATQDISGLAAGIYSVTVSDSKGQTASESFTVNQPAAALSISVDNITHETSFGANDGAINISVSGGTPGYSYAWSNNATNEDLSGLAPGNYSVTVTDANGCTQNSGTITVNAAAAAPPVINEQASNVTNINCFGQATGAITLSVSEGTPPYTYAWSNNATGKDLNGLAAGNYSVTVTDANGLTDNASFTLSQPAAALSIAVTGVTHQSNPGNSDGAINITVSGGTSPYTYSWSNGPTTEDLSGLAPGNYIVTVTDANGCTAVSGSITVNEADAEPPVIDENGSAVTNANCFGASNGAITLIVNGGTTPYAFAWSNGATTKDISGLAAGSYTVTVTDANDLTDSFTFNIGQPTELVISNVGVTDNSACSGNPSGAVEITVGGGTSGYSYLWSNGATSEDISGLADGNYTVTITDANGCTKAGGPYTVNLSASGSPINITVTNTVQPNCNGENNGVIDITVTGGAQPYTFNWTNNGAFVSSLEDLSGIFAGTYNIRVSDANGCSSSRNVVLNQPTVISIGALITNESSAGAKDGEIDIAAGGGSPPYSYAWSNGATTKDIVNLSGGSYTVTVTDSHNCTASENITVGIDNITPLSVNGTVQNVTCFNAADGSIDISVTGGLSPYTYAWSNGAGNIEDLSNLSGGTYTVTVTDAVNKTAVKNFTVVQPNSVINITSHSIVDESGARNDGMINITPSGGVAPYSFVWSNGATVEDPDNLASDSYRVTITDAHKCVFVSDDYFVDFIPFPISLEVSTQSTSCSEENDGSIELKIKGGDPVFSISWSNEITTTAAESNPTVRLNNLAPGNYSVTITDGNGQVFNRNGIEIKAPAALGIVPSANPPSNAAGNNGSIDITVTGGVPPYDYKWNNGAVSEDITGLMEGEYQVTITDANKCVFISQMIPMDAPLGVGVNAITHVTCPGVKTGAIDLLVYGGNPSYSYRWSNDATTEDINNLAPGVYAVTVTDGDGNEFTVDNIEVQLTSTFAATGVVTSVYNGGFNISGNGRKDGSATVTATGGTPPYSYLWSSGMPVGDGSTVTGLGGGRQTVTVIDDTGCRTLVEFNLTEPQALRASMDVLSTIECSGECTGQAKAVASGGVGPYTYRWNADNTIGELAFDLCAGTYVVTITDANNVELLQVFSFEEPQPLSLDLSADPPSSLQSSDGTVRVDVEGGVEPYSITWNDQSGCRTPECSGLPYSTDSLYVIVSDGNGCMQIGSVVVPTPPDDCLIGRPVITPDGDGLNDVFIITCIDDFENNIEIYNRWGQLVYQAENYDNNWNGTNQRGTDLPDGPYYYVLEATNPANGDKMQKKGSITVLREN